MFNRIERTLGSPDQESQEGNELRDEDIERVADEIEKEILEVPPKAEYPFFLAPTGMIASGKSTIVKALAKEFNLVVIRNDSIRGALEKRGYNLRRASEITAHFIIKFAKLGHGIAIDADVVRAKDRASLTELARALGIRIVSVKIDTPEEVIIQRLDASNEAREYKGEEAVKRYYERKELHEGDAFDYDVVLDGSADFSEETQGAIKKIKEMLK
jgi:predicted kinase